MHDSVGDFLTPMAVTLRAPLCGKPSSQVATHDKGHPTLNVPFPTDMGRSICGTEEVSFHIQRP